MLQYLKNQYWDGIPGKAIPTAAPYVFSSSSQNWIPYNSASSTSTSLYPFIPFTCTKPITLFSWNIDAGRPSPQERMRSVIAYLQTTAVNTTLDIIQLQEVHPIALEFLLLDGWIQLHYATTFLELPEYSKKYGTITLISKRRVSAVVRIFRSPFEMSVMGRDALIVDIKTGHDGKGGIVRFVNVHLESLQGYGSKAREAQMLECFDMVCRRGVVGGILAGDVNAIAMEDVSLPRRIGFVDFWESKDGDHKVLSGDVDISEEDTEGFTWGYQPPGGFPPGRLDKVLAKGAVSGEVKVVGKGLRLIEQGDAGEELGGSKDNLEENFAAGDWISDHFALLATVRLNSNK